MGVQALSTFRRQPTLDIRRFKRLGFPGVSGTDSVHDSIIGDFSAQGYVHGGKYEVSFRNSHHGGPMN